jgi:hypothetical protein
MHTVRASCKRFECGGGRTVHSQKADLASRGTRPPTKVYVVVKCLCMIRAFGRRADEIQHDLVLLTAYVRKYCVAYRES